MRATTLALASVALLISPASAAGARLIDDFTDGAIQLVHGGAEIQQSQTGLDPATVIGGRRIISVGAMGSGAAGQSATVDTDAGTLTFSSGPSSLGYFELEYGTQTMPLNVDLTAGGATHLAIVFEPAPIPPGTAFPPFASVNAQAAGGRIGFTSAVPLGNGRFIAKAPFAGNDHVDWNNVQRIYFNFLRYPTGGSFIIHEIAAVPEPAAASLAISSLCAVAAFRRRCVSATR